MRTEVILSYYIKNGENIPHYELYVLQDNIENFVRESWAHGMREGSYSEVVEYMISPSEMVSKEYNIYWSVKYKHGGE